MMALTLLAHIDRTIDIELPGIMDQQLKAIANIRSSAIDGRVHNPIFRKEQLKKLHQALVKKASTLQNAMEEGDALTATEIKLEYCLALQCIAEVQDGIDPREVLEAEYAIADGVDAPDARHPIGIAVIEPSSFAFLYSLVAAVAPAIAAGNCIIVQVRHVMVFKQRRLTSVIDGSFIPKTASACPRYPG